MPCPICANNAEVSGVRVAPGGRHGHLVTCERCGAYFVTEEALEDLPGTVRRDAELIARVAHGVQRMQRGAQHPFLTTGLLQHFVNSSLPSVFEQANSLIRWLGEHGHGPGENVQLNAHHDLYIVGAKSPAGFVFLIEHLQSAGYIVGSMEGGGQGHMTLTFRGWELFDRIQRGQVDSRKAFMAMKYGDETLERIVNEFFRPAVVQTGFSLARLDDEPRAGLIDDRLRVEIRNSRFLVADLSHDNLGAYWEAGHAEGLGKPVIYTCERGKFEQARPHFDTNHHLTVIWDADNPQAAAMHLKATIRATLPDEAKLADE